MFRRLAEAFQNENHDQYIKKQNSYFNTLPNMILSGTSGLKGFDTAIQSINTQGTNYQKPPIKNPNNIFIQETSAEVNNLAAACSSSSIDQLIAIKNPNASIGCGWLYTPPNKGSPYPTISQGFIGDSNGPLSALSPPDHKKWFFDLQLAKKQMLLDKCKALKACTDVDSEAFKGQCGYCTDTNQGVPIDTVGQPLYGGDSLGSCSPTSLITTGKNCPIINKDIGPQPIIDKTCDPVNGRLSATCLYNQVLTGGCSNNGTLAAALSGSNNPDNYISDITNADAVKIYNRVANPPLKLDIFRQGSTTVDAVLKEVRQLAGNTKQPENSALGASARDLCLQAGSITKYDFCNDLPDTTLPPFDMNCLQQIFKKMGGAAAGLSYPRLQTMTIYNSMTTLGEVKQYINRLMEGMKSSDYNTQRNSMIQFLGISPDKLIQRAPYNQGVEVIWLQPRLGYSNQIWGILKRTIENDIIQYGPGTVSIIPQLSSTYPGFSEYSAMIQMFDLRATTDFSVKFNVTIDDGFFIAVNQPANIATTAFNNIYADQVGLFANLGIQGPTTYNSNMCSNYFADNPNITKMYYTDAGGGGHTFQLSTTACAGQNTFNAPKYSLTLEPRAPYLNFEVNKVGDTFDDTRNPGLFSSLLITGSLEFHNRPEERMFVPGNKGFVRFTNNSSLISLQNIAYQAWATCTFAFKLQSMPIKDAIFTFRVWNKYCIFYLQPNSGSSAQLRIQTNMTSNGTVYDGATSINIGIGQWYYMKVGQNGVGFDVYCDTIDNILKNGNFTTTYVSITNNGPITTTYNNGLVYGSQYACNVDIGGKASGTGFSNATFQFDLAWVHFYDHSINAADVLKDCKSEWIFTQFPDSTNTYKT